MGAYVRSRIGPMGPCRAINGTKMGSVLGHDDLGAYMGPGFSEVLQNFKLEGSTKNKEPNIQTCFRTFFFDPPGSPYTFFGPPILRDGDG